MLVAHPSRLVDPPALRQAAVELSFSRPTKLSGGGEGRRLLWVRPAAAVG